MPKKVSNIEGSPKIYKDLCRRVHPPIPESIECFIEDQEFSPLYNLALPTTPPPSTVSKVNRRHTGRLTKRDNLLTGVGGGGGGGRSQVTPPQERLVLYKSLYTLWSYPKGGLDDWAG
jgi:hypothetical protein